MLIYPIKILKIVMLWLIVFRMRRNCARNLYKNKQKNIELGEINGGLIVTNMNAHIDFKLVEKINDNLSMLCKIYYYQKFKRFYFKIWIASNPMSLLQFLIINYGWIKWLQVSYLETNIFISIHYPFIILIEF